MIVYPATFLGNSTWRFDTQTLSWPSSTAGYTQYTGLINGTSTQGYTGNILLGFQFFFQAGEPGGGPSVSGIKISTNAQFSGLDQVDIVNNTPTVGNGTYPLYNLNSRVGGNELVLGAVLSDGDTQGIWTRRGNFGTKYFFHAIVYSGIGGNPSGISSYLFSLYRDPQFQWMVTRTKTTPNSTFAGPYFPGGDVSQPAATTSKVWRAYKTTGFSYINWEYMGTGSVL
jgi:hypothetical protein